MLCGVLQEVPLKVAISPSSPAARQNELDAHETFGNVIPIATGSLQLLPLNVTASEIPVAAQNEGDVHDTLLGSAPCIGMGVLHELPSKVTASPGLLRKPPTAMQNDEDGQDSDSMSCASSPVGWTFHEPSS